MEVNRISGDFLETECPDEISRILRVDSIILIEPHRTYADEKEGTLLTLADGTKVASTISYDELTKLFGLEFT